MSETAPTAVPQVLTAEDARHVVTSHYSYFPAGYHGHVDALRAHATGTLVSIRADDLAALRAELELLQQLKSSRSAAFLACTNGDVALHVEDALEIGGTSSLELFQLRQDAAVGIAVWRFFDRLRAACRDAGPAEVILQQLTKLVEPMFGVNRAPEKPHD